ncbi:MAG: ABC transporter permease [Acidimicrobiales bacterium]
MTAAEGAVYDRGYRPYEGVRGGRGAAILALWKASMRRAVGLRRAWRQKVMPWSLLAIATVPAIVNVGIAYVTRDTPIEDFEFITYRDYVGVSMALLVFVAIAAPDVICPDRRYRVLPLIFARPLDGRDYVFAKVGAIFTLVFAFGFLPQVVLFVGQMLVSDEALTYLTDHAEVIWQVPLAVALLALYFSTVSVALSSLTNRRVAAGVMVLGLNLVTSAVAGILVSVNGEESGAALLNLLGIPLYLRDLVFLGEIGSDTSLSGTQGGGALAIVVYTVVVAIGMSVLLYRYAEADRT